MSVFILLRMISNFILQLSKEGKISANSSYEKLPGDASNRSYARILDPDSGKSFILMVLAIEAFKSEEAGSAGVKTEELDFVYIGRDWYQQKITVPEIIYVDPESRFLLIEDFGSVDLYQKRQEAAALDLYKDALDKLHQIQQLRPNDLIHSRSFNLELLKWELEHFIEYGLQERKQELSKTDLSFIREKFEAVFSRLTKQDYVVTHRDYHSKNLIVLNDRSIGVIDFQDALMGPDTYDLASLLRDSYVQLKEEEEAELIAYFNSLRKHQIDVELFHWVSLQRNLKACGRFFYIDLVKKRPTHLPYVKPTMERVFKTLEQLNESELLGILKKCHWTV